MSSEKRPYELKKRAEQQDATRLRIVEATAALHEEVGPARTTVSEIARRAGVQRPTVYAHFPEEQQLFGACQAHWMSKHPPPDLGPAMADPDPAGRLRKALAAIYGNYRKTAPLTGKIMRDRELLPALDAQMRATVDAQMAALADGLSIGFDASDGRAPHVRAMMGVALDFWAWKRLDSQGLNTEDAAALMTDAVSCLSR